MVIRTGRFRYVWNNILEWRDHYLARQEPLDPEMPDAAKKLIRDMVEHHFSNGGRRKLLSLAQAMKAVNWPAEKAHEFAAAHSKTWDGRTIRYAASGFEYYDPAALKTRDPKPRKKTVTFLSKRALQLAADVEILVKYPVIEKRAKRALESILRRIKEDVGSVIRDLNQMKDSVSDRHWELYNQLLNTRAISLVLRLEGNGTQAAAEAFRRYVQANKRNGNGGQAHSLFNHSIWRYTGAGARHELGHWLMAWVAALVAWDSVYIPRSIQISGEHPFGKNPRYFAGSNWTGRDNSGGTY